MRRLLGALSLVLLASLSLGGRLTPEENAQRLRICGKPLSALQNAASPQPASSPDDDEDDGPQFKVMGGRDSGRRPHAVQVIYKFDKEKDPAPCGGTMISSRHVLTAAHCVYDYWKFCPIMGMRTGVSERKDYIRDDLSAWTIVLKSRCGTMNNDEECNSKDPKIFAKPKKIFANRRFVDAKCMQGGDIAIIELDRDFGPELGVVPACLATESTVVDRYTNLTSFGWGSDPTLKYQGKIFHNILQEIDLKEQNCPGGSPLDVICTEEKSDKNVCSGDSGGGLTLGKPITGYTAVVGLVSTGTGCEKMFVFPWMKFDGGMFTDTRLYNGFICKVTGVCPMRRRDPAKRFRKQQKVVVDEIDVY